MTPRHSGPTTGRGPQHFGCGRSFLAIAVFWNGAQKLGHPGHPARACGWDRGEPHGSSPPTPPYVRVRIRRFGGLSGYLFPREGWPPGFGNVHRRGRFGPCITALLGFTLRS